MRAYLFSLALACSGVLAADSDEVAVGLFSANPAGDALPAGWQPYKIAGGKRETQYSLAKIDGRTVLEARASQSVSALAYPLSADPKRTPWLSFSWRTERLIEKADVRSKAGDDYPARVYVVFDYDIARLPFGERTKMRMARSLWGDQLPVAALCYIWEPRQPVGYTQWSAYTNRLRMIVVESGSARLGRWVDIERNVVEDFRAAFGEQAPPISAIIVAADTDNTGETAHTWFGDISLRSRPAGPR